MKLKVRMRITPSLREMEIRITRSKKVDAKASIL